MKYVVLLIGALAWGFLTAGVPSPWDIPVWVVGGGGMGYLTHRVL